ncbi:MAG: hypothetical protein AB7Q64_08440 [Verrucomicrobiales bacterium]
MIEPDEKRIGERAFRLFSWGILDLAEEMGLTIFYADNPRGKDGGDVSDRELRFQNVAMAWVLDKCNDEQAVREAVLAGPEAWEPLVRAYANNFPVGAMRAFREWMSHCGRMTTAAAVKVVRESGGNDEAPLGKSVSPAQ